MNNYQLAREQQESEFRLLEGDDIVTALEMIKGEYVDRKGWEKDFSDKYTFASHYFAIYKDDLIRCVLRAVDGRRTEGKLPLCEHGNFESFDFNNAVELSRFVGRGASTQEHAMLYCMSLEYLFSLDYRCLGFVRQGLSVMIEKRLGIVLSSIGPSKKFKGKTFIPVEFSTC